MSDEPSHMGIGGGEWYPLSGTDMVGDPHTWMPDIWEGLIAKYGIKSMVDVGCGLGATPKWFMDHGVDSVGVEGWQEFIDKNYMPWGHLYRHDYATGPIILNRTFDLGWSAEFVEHVEERFMANFLLTFLSCHYVCFTHALPNQGGYHHVNEQTTEYWIERMKLIGYEHMAEESAEMRKTADWAYGRITLSMFKKR